MNIEEDCPSSNNNIKKYGTMIIYLLLSLKSDAFMLGCL